MSEEVDIQIPDIEKTLSMLTASGGNKDKIKACLFTLIIYAHKPSIINYLQDLIDTILDKFPCRIIFIQNDSESFDHYLHVDATTVTSGRKEATVICDQVTIKTSPSELRRIVQIVISHIVPDLPIYLLWSQTPFAERTIFPTLQPYASRIIFDSECSENLQQFSKEMLQNLKLLHMDMMDVNWAFISNWRDMFVQLLDSPAKLAVLKNCKTLKITYNDAKTEPFRNPEIRSMYLQGWLAVRFQWDYYATEKYQNNTIISYTTHSNPVIVVLSPETNTNLTPGAIISIELTSSDGYSFYISRKQSLSQVVVHASSPEKCEIPYTLPLPDVYQGLTFMKEIFYYSLGDHYQDMLKIIAKVDRVVS